MCWLGTGDVGCVGEGRCKPCSRFEMNRQVEECLRTGYRQWAYCPRDKTSKYIRCDCERHFMCNYMPIMPLQLSLQCRSQKAKSILAISGLCTSTVVHTETVSVCTQAIAVLIGSLSLVAVHWRQARIDKIVTHRIERQIRA